ncbi:anaphase-promoting complex subunit 11 [Pyrus communis]|uniref:anaphase-promoting complex subunit 11 n=1 Tax=Pyrus communis TaxID=23211 RepID=UPI0035BF7996
MTYSRNFYYWAHLQNVKHYEFKFSPIEWWSLNPPKTGPRLFLFQLGFCRHGDIERATGTGTGIGIRVRFLQWHAVASWTWDAQDETCGICRMAFDGCCPDCKLPGDDCPLIWGACNHAFHLHCILKWVNSQTSQAHCPMCRREWQFKG